MTSEHLSDAEIEKGWADIPLRKWVEMADERDVEIRDLRATVEALRGALRVWVRSEKLTDAGFVLVNVGEIHALLGSSQ